MKQTRYRTAIRNCEEYRWEAFNDVTPGAWVKFRNIKTGRVFVRRVSP